MKTFLPIILLVLMSHFSQSQTEETLPKLNAPIGLTFGCSVEQAKVILTQKGGKIDLKNSKNDVFIFDDVMIGLRKSLFFRVKFVKNKLYKVEIIFLATLESKTQELYDGIKTDIEGKYGLGECYRNFKDVYKDGDGYEMQAVKLGYASINCFWMSFQNESAISLEITPILTVQLTYEDGKLIKEKIQEQNQIKSTDY